MPESVTVPKPGMLLLELATLMHRLSMVSNEIDGIHEALSELLGTVGPPDLSGEQFDAFWETVWTAAAQDDEAGDA